MRLIPLAAAFALSLWLPAASAAEATTAGVATPGLDLSVPQDGPVPTWGAGDPPGTWYGDTSGVPADEARAAAPVRRTAACPTAPDGSESTVTGSLTTGIGTSRAGTSRFNAASVNVCREYTTDSGRSGTMNLQINVAEGDGPGMYYRPHYGYGPMASPYFGGYGPAR